MSRYDTSKDVTYRGTEIKGILGNYSWLRTKPSDSSIRTFKVTTQTAGSPRRIATQIYGDHNLYWVLAAFNNKWYNDAGALSVLNWPAAGQVIYYPDPLTVSTSL